MRVRSLREHYHKIDGVYKPKKGYDSVDDVDRKRYKPSKWNLYPCGVCGKLHHSKIENKKVKDGR